MSDTEYAINTIVDQWATLILARYYQCSGYHISELQAKVAQLSTENRKNKGLKLPIDPAYNLCSKTDPEKLQIMIDAAQEALSSFSSHASFPKVFTMMITLAHGIFMINLSMDGGSQKQKSLHTEAITNEEILTDSQSLLCNVFQYLSTILDNASQICYASFDSIDVSVVSIIFHFMNHDQPNAVRASAGKILSELSSSAQHSRAICDLFWKQFGLCKKDDDFRNFASWIDGVELIQLSINTPQLSELSLQFLNNFVVNSKKIERGVLRMKFLDALLAILERLSKSPMASSNTEFNRLLGEIWGIAVKWSSKSKHTSFCYTFLCHLLKVALPQFFLNEHGPKFGEMLSKYAKGGDIEMLNLLVEYIRISPKEYTSARVDEFIKLVETQVIPILISGNDKKKSLRFKENDQIEATTKIFVEIGVQQISVISDNARVVLAAEKPNEDHKRVRLVFMDVLARLCERVPENIVLHNTQLFPFFEQILLKSSLGLPEELQFAIGTFPLIHSSNETKLVQISQVLYDLSLSSNENAFSSLKGFISNLVNLNSNARLPLTYIEKLMEGINDLPKEDIVKRLGLIKGISQSLSESLEKQSGNFRFVTNGTSSMTAQDWITFRTKLDKVMICLLLDCQSEISKMAEELMIVFQNNSIKEMDRTCSQSSYFISNWHQEIPEKLDFLTSTEILISKNISHSQLLYESVLEYWRTHRKQINPQTGSRMLLFISTIARPRTDGKNTLKPFFEEFFCYSKENPSSSDVPKAISCLNTSLWVLFINELNQWMGTTGVAPASFWAQNVVFYSTLSQRTEFSLQIEEQAKLSEQYERFLISFWKGAPKVSMTPDSLSLVEKCMKILHIYVEKSSQKLTHIVESSPESVQAFVDSILSLLNVSFSSSFPTTYVETFLVSLKTVLTHIQFTSIEMYTEFSIWLSKIAQFYESNEQVQMITTQLLTTILEKNPMLLRIFFQLTFSSFGLLGSHYILAIANTYQSQNNFVSEYPQASATVLCTILYHIENSLLVCRQAVLKLMCLSLEIVGGSNEALTMPITSETPAGFVSQAKTFISYISKSLNNELAFAIFKIFSEDLLLIKESQNQVLISLINLIPIMIRGAKLSEIINMLLKLTTKSRISEADIAKSVHSLWSYFFVSFKEVFGSQIDELIQIVFEYGICQDSLKSQESIVSVLVLVDAFEEFPEKVSTFLIPFLCKYQRVIPEDLNEFTSFLMKANIRFDITKEEIIAYNSLSQILFLVKDQQQFKDLFMPSLAPLAYYSTMMYHIELFDIGPFHPLLDSLLDAALFRLVDSNSKFSSNLHTLQFSNLIKRATSLEPQYQIVTTMPAKQMLCYDREAIRSLTTLLCQSDPDFKFKFFELVLANAFQVENCERSMEPFIIMMALDDMLNTKIVFKLLLLTLFAFNTGRTELVDSLIDNIHQRLMSQSIDEATFEEEALPVLIVFILSLSLEFKRSFSIHLMRIIADICSKICQMNCSKTIAKGLIDFMKVFNGDQYIASLFRRFVEDVQTFSDSSITDIIRALFELSKLIGVVTSSFNWCFLFALLIDSTRYHLGSICQRPQPQTIVFEGLDMTTIQSFVSFLVENFTQDHHKQFIVTYLCALFKNFHTTDLYLDTVAMQIMNHYLRTASVQLLPTTTDSLLRLLFLVSLTSDIKGREAASSALSFLISNLTYKADQTSMSLPLIQPKFILVKRKPIGHYLAHDRQVVDPNQIPNFSLFSFSGMEMAAIIDTLWQFITSKISPNGEKFRMPDFSVKENGTIEE